MNEMCRFRAISTKLMQQQNFKFQIAVNGKSYLKIPQPNRHKVILFGLNLEQPLRLTLSRSSGDLLIEESTITYIN